MEHQLEHEDDEKHLKDEDDEKQLKEEDDEQSIDRLRSSSSVSSTSDIESAITDFNFEEQDQIDGHDHGSFAIDHEQDEAHLGYALALQSPKVQTMERPAESSSGYRIPSYVFARNKSTNPEWSVASNESLFSIHTGNMSFTRDTFNWLLKSGELGIYGGAGDMPKSGELPPLSPRYVSYPTEPKPVDTHKEEKIPSSSHMHKEEQVPAKSHQHREEQVLATSHQQKEEQVPISSPKTQKPGEEIIAAHFKTSASTQRDKERDDLKKTSKPQVTEAADLGTGGAKKDEHVSETKEKRSSASTSPSDDIPLTNSKSHHSDASGQSFAFPVLAEIGRDKSINSAQSQARSDHQKNSLQNDQEADKPPKTTTEVAQHKSYYSWFTSCFCCCCRCCRSCW